MTESIKMAAILLAIGAVFIFGWLVRGWRDEAALESQEKAAVVEIQKIQQQAQYDARVYEQSRAAANSTITQLNQKIGVYRAKNHIAADCFIPADGLRAVAAAIKSGSAR